MYMLIEKWVRRLSKRGSDLDGEWDLGRILYRLCYSGVGKLSLFIP